MVATEFRELVDLIKRLKTEKHKRQVELKWILDSVSVEKREGVVKTLESMKEAGVIKEELTSKARKTIYSLTDAPLQKKENVIISDEGKGVTRQELDDFKSDILLRIKLISDSQQRHQGFQKSFFLDETINLLRIEIQAKNHVIGLLSTENERLKSLVNNPVCTPNLVDKTSISTASGNSNRETSTTRHPRATEPPWTLVNSNKRNNSGRSWNVQNNLSHSTPIQSARDSNRFRTLRFENNAETEETLNVYKNYEDNATPYVSNETNKRPAEVKLSVRKRPTVEVTERQVVNNSAPYRRQTVPASFEDKEKYGRKVYLVGDSHINLKVNRRQLASRVHQKSRIFIKSFGGATTKQVNWHVEPIIVDEDPDVCLIHTGGNNVNRGESDPQLIANEILNTGLKCRNMGVNNVFISGLFPFNDPTKMEIANSVNSILKGECHSNAFIFVDNSNILPEHLFKDGIHLDNDHKHIFIDNIINALNNNFLV